MQDEPDWRIIMDSNSIISAMKQANSMILSIEEMRSYLDRRLATKFSIFDPMGYGERTLSKIIGMLLDPKGNHGQGSMFLKEFLEVLCLANTRNEKIRNFLTNNLENAKVKCEYGTKEGRFIDVVVTAGNLKFGIENKINAGDLNNQVADYLESVDFLVYLSKDRMSPSEYSISQDECEKAIQSGSLLIMHYKSSSTSYHIKESALSDNISTACLSGWLKRCEHTSESDKVRWYLREVLELIHAKIYGERTFMGDCMLDDILLKNKEVTDAFIELHQYHDSLTDKLVENFCNCMVKKFKQALQPFSEWLEIIDNPPNRQSLEAAVKGAQNGAKSIIDITPHNGKFGHFNVFFWGTEYRGMYFQWNSHNNSNHETFKTFFNGDIGNEHGYVWKQFEIQDFRSPDALKKLNEFHHDREASELAILVKEVVDSAVNFFKNLNQE